MNVLDRLVAAIEGAGIYNRHDLASPRVVLWTDGDRLWTKVLPLLQSSMPQLIVLDPAEVAARRGPTTVVRYLLDRGDAAKTSVVYLPGVPRQAFRGAAGFPEEAKHLFALQHLGQFWSQTNGKDWTPSAFLTSVDGGLALEVAKDSQTREALLEQLENVLTTPFDQLSGRRLDAVAFHGLASADPIRSMLQWMSEPEKVLSDWKVADWKGFIGLAKKQFAIDPEKDGVLIAADRLAEGATPAWNAVWKRYAEAPRSFPGVRALLGRVRPPELLSAYQERHPTANQADEAYLRVSLTSLATVPHNVALAKLAELCEAHAPRAKWVWAELGEAPLAIAAQHLGAMAARIKSGVPGNDWDGLAKSYPDSGAVVDACARRAYASVREAPDVQAVTAGLRAVYLPWLESLAERVSGMTQSYPNRDSLSAWDFKPEPGTVLLFVDGLRFDLGMELTESLRGRGFVAGVEARWSALPTVTATAKPAWGPMSTRLNGDAISEGFEPAIAESGKPLRTQDFRKLLVEIGWGWLEPGGLGDPKGSSWTEVGAFDQQGHTQGAKLAWHIGEELRATAERIRELLQSGWKKVRVITDHGWLWMPGGLPKVDLPKHLTVSKWGRCAVPMPGAQHAFQETPWFWGGGHSVVLAPGVSVFLGSQEYAHGGLSLQEALTPVLTVKVGKADVAAEVNFLSVKWIGLRVHVEVGGNVVGVEVDLRRKLADPATSLLGAPQKGKLLDPEGKASVVVEDDSVLGDPAHLVLSRNGQVLAKQLVTVGGD